MDATSKVAFFVSCKGLKNSDILDQSDPFAVASVGHVKEDGRIEYTEMGRTETINNTSDPEWTHQFVMDFYFIEIQHLKVEVYDHDTLTADDALGQATFTLGALLAAPGRTVTEQLKHRGVLIVRGEEVSSCADRIRLTMRGIGLKNKDGLFGKSDPFFVMLRMREDELWQKVHRSPPVMNDLNPQWDPQEISVQALCNGDYLHPLRIEVWDWDRNGKHDHLGVLTTNLQALLEGQGEEMQLEHRKPGKKGKGSLKVERAEIFREHTLLDYVAGGLQINLMVAIDFTGSNGSPSEPDSLHYLIPSGRLNQYQQAVVSIGNILQDYDTDKMFPVYGFGGMFEGQPVSHCFPIYGRGNEGGEARGVDGILAAYSAALSHVRLAGPTLFTEVLQTAMARASQPPLDRTDQRYHVLLILTDGIINDMRQTIDSLVAASKMPLSVVIVGVGHADFSDMSELDGDDGTLRDTEGNKAARDIVQFVPFSKYPPGDAGTKSRLAADTMAEIPGQVLKYFSAKGITPNPPRLARPLPSVEQAIPTAPAAYEEVCPDYEDNPPPYTP